MTHSHSEDEIREYAALYALGGLSQFEARSFEEHLDAGCETCRTELQAFDSVVEQLAWAEVTVAPAVDVRERLLACVAEEAAARAVDANSSAPETNLPNAGIFIIPAGAGEWQPTPDEGVFAKELFRNEGSGLVTSLVRMSPGARVPRHRHIGIEQCLVLEGDLRTGGDVTTSGDYICAPAHTIHQELHTEQGNLLLIIAPASFEVLPPAPEQHA
jgi:anti-sigma factor ChrR (cupin superfamily)